MSERRNRYKEMERNMTYALLADAVLYVLYLIFAGLGVIWLKVILAVLAIGLSGLCLAVLFLSNELFKPRSLWMSAGAGAIAICILFSLILNFPSPNKYKNNDVNPSTDTSVVETT